MLIYGTGGHAKVVYDCLKSMRQEVELFFDDRIVENPFFGKQVMAYNQGLFPERPLLLAVGDNAARRNLAHKVFHRFGVAVHTSAVVSDFAEIGVGSMIIHNAVVQSHAAVGRHVIVNTAATVDHDCRIGDFVHLAPKSTLCEGVVVGDGALVGAGAVVLPGVNIGKWAVVGAGSVVLSNVEEGTVVVGNPAKVINRI